MWAAWNMSSLVGSMAGGCGNMGKLDYLLLHYCILTVYVNESLNM